MLSRIVFALFVLHSVQSKFSNFDLSALKPDLSKSSEEQDDRLAIWSNLLEELAQGNVNVSIIGWQHVYDVDGRIKQVDTVELAFPVSSNPHVKNFLDDFDKNEDFHSRKIQHEFIKNFEGYKTLSEKGLIVDAFVEFEKDAHDSILFYWNPETTYFRPDGLVTFNKTLVATNEQIDNFTSAEVLQKHHSVQPIVLKYDSDGILKVNESVTSSPTLLAYVADSWQASDWVLLESAGFLAEVALTHKKEEIPEKLAEKFNHAFPNYEWRVLVNPGGTSLIKDVWVELSLDGFEFYQGDKDVYKVYGVSKPTTV